MTQPQATAAPKKKRSASSFFLWWRVDPMEVEKQVIDYRTLRPWQSARGISLLLCLFTVAVTLLFGRLFGVSFGSAVIESAIWIVLGLLIYRGHGWACVVAMILWTLDKGTVMIAQGSAGRTANPVIQIIWWLIYMNAFFLAFKVERARRAQTSPGHPATS